MKNLGRWVTWLLIMSSAYVVQAKSGPEIQYLDTYDQLSKCIGQEGHWFVRDAANTKTGQHGDPTVQKGWAIYTWDTLIYGWRKICEEESLDNSVSEALLREYVKTSVFNAAMESLRTTYVTLQKYNTDITALTQRVTKNTSDNVKQDGEIVKAKSAAAAADTKADFANSEVARLREMITSLDIDKVKLLLLDTTNRVARAETKVSELDQTVENVTNVVYSFDGRVAALEVTVAGHTQVITATTNSIRLLSSAVSELRNEMNGVLDDIPKLYAGLNSESQRVDRVEQEILGILNQAKQYTDQEVETLKEDMISRDAGILSEAKKYHDEHPGVDEDAVRTIASGLDDEVKDELTTSFDEKIATKEEEFKTIISNKSEEVYADMRAGDSNTLTQANAYTDEKVKGVDLGAMIYGPTVKLGAGATNEAAYAHKGSILINTSPLYPSTVGTGFTDTNKNSYAISIGADNKVATETDARYAVAIGTSAVAANIHSYAFGSQINAFAADSTVMGYGATASDAWSTVIGHGNRSIHDISFNRIEGGKTIYDYQAMTNFFSDANNKNQFFVGEGILCGGGPGCNFIVDAVYEYPDINTGMYVLLRENPDDIEVGYRRWDYGKSHGIGTFNIIARGSGGHIYDLDTGSRDPGIAGVYINDKSIADWTGIHIGEMTVKPIYNKGILGPGTSTCQNDYTIAIGSNARALETASSCQAVAIGRDALSAGSATVAVGPNAFAYGSLATALGWRANAIGEHSIAIGNAKKSGQNYFVDGVVNTNSDLCAAIGADSIAIGYNTKSYGKRGVSVGYYANSKADNAVQIGMGTNDVANSVKFYDTTVFKDGKLIGSFNPEDLDPTERVIDQTLEITAKAHTVNTLAVEEGVELDEIGINPEGSRNFEIYIPNDESIRRGLPIIVDTEIAEVKKPLWLSDETVVSHLPAMIKVQQPRKDTVLFTLKMLDDGSVWTPGVTNVCMKWNNLQGKFYTEGKSALLGTNLHMATSFKLTYPTNSTGKATIDLLQLKPGTTYKVGTLYGSIGSYEYAPTADAPLYFDGRTSWFEMTYETVNGEAVIERQIIDLDAE